MLHEIKLAVDRYRLKAFGSEFKRQIRPHKTDVGQVESEV